MTPAIIVIGYNRPDSLKRLLNSLNKAFYPKSVNPTLIISLDKCDDDATAKAAEEFNWEHGEKRVVLKSKRLGLKKHVLSCGDYTEEFGSIIVLEDDLLVSPAFYEYSMKALDFTDGDDRIGGVSLYNHLFNVHVRESFCALFDGYDNWYFQLASSWGQAYTKSQWEGFKNWLLKYSDSDKTAELNNRMKTDPRLPANVSGWSDKSWLKYYIFYLVDTNRYFMYPQISYTTNFGDVGSHMKKADTDLQVPISLDAKSLYLQFSTLDNSNSVYDAYFENTKLSDKLVCGNTMICDLYGSKPLAELSVNADYILSSTPLKFKAVKSFGRMMRPHDANIFYEIPGDDFYLYEINKDEINKGIVKSSKASSKTPAQKWFYQYRGISAAQMLDMLRYRINEKITRK